LYFTTNILQVIANK